MQQYRYNELDILILKQHLARDHCGMLMQSFTICEMIGVILTFLLFFCFYLCTLCTFFHFYLCTVCTIFIIIII